VARAHFGGKGKRLPLTGRRLPEGVLGRAGAAWFCWPASGWTTLEVSNDKQCPSNGKNRSFWGLRPAPDACYCGGVEQRGRPLDLLGARR